MAFTMEATLNDAEQMLAKYLAEKRYDSNRASKIRNAKIGPQSNQETDLNGIGGEIAFCKMFGAYPDMSISPRHGGFDCLWRGKKVDVKTTKYTTGKLIARKSKDKSSADLYVLIVGQFPRYAYKGMASSDELFKNENIVNLGYGDTYALDQSKLRD